MSIGERLHYLREEELDISQEEFGNRIGVSRFSISNYESGKRSLTARVITDICREFGVNEVWLRTGEGGTDNMFTKLDPADRFTISLGTLSSSENQFVQNAVNYLAESDPEKLKVLEELMKACLGIK
ncbi:helix-turn-helix domain-containing protein [Eisenbergiella tayi]|uniref:helix-turn-helix domain-containing protein n=1 Tax=Eisenbergiella tayi TaxID=1432052 RepID=UPI0009BCAC5A|nr:helix-turn-helix domain-containing protein [Eisenbergiella tayi]